MARICTWIRHSASVVWSNAKRLLLPSPHSRFQRGLYKIMVWWLIFTAANIVLLGILLVAARAATPAAPSLQTAADECGTEFERRFGNTAPNRWPDQVWCAIKKIHQPVPDWVVKTCISQVEAATRGKCLQCAEHVIPALKCSVRE